MPTSRTRGSPDPFLTVPIPWTTLPQCPSCIFLALENYTLPNHRAFECAVWKAHATLPSNSFPLHTDPSYTTSFLLVSLLLSPSHRTQKTYFCKSPSINILNFSYPQSLWQLLNTVVTGKTATDNIERLGTAAFQENFIDTEN